MKKSDHWLEATTASAEPPKQTRSRTHRRSKWVLALPALALIGLVSLFGFAFRDRLLPGIPVRVAVAVALPLATEETPANADGGGRAQLLFQATGWIEPDPLPIRVTPLYSGVARTVHVLEGQTVTNGQLLVTLVDDDTRLAVRKAEARAAQARAVKEALSAELELARARRVTAERKHDEETARLAVEEDRLRRMEGLQEGTVPEQERVQARLDRQSRAAAAAGAKATVAEWNAEANRVARRIEVQTQLIAVAETELAEAQLAQSRTEVRSPVDGVILRLLATPGKRLMLNMDHPDSATAAILYEPDKLQARVDVPLADAGRLAVGQKVRVACSLLPDERFDGVVTRIVGEADLQRNTLQAKVRIQNPDPRLRPEMLCRAEFFGAASGVAEAESALALYVPIAALRDRKDGQARVWLLAEDRRHAVSESVTLGDEREGHVRVREGVRPGDRVIVDPPAGLTDGARIEATEIDEPEP